MGDLVNLRSYRKKRAREDNESKAQENRIAFGRTKAEREGAEADKTRERLRLDGHKRDSGVQSQDAPPNGPRGKARQEEADEPRNEV